MKKNNRANSFMWTKDDIKKVIQLWESSTKEELAKEIGCSMDNINYISNQLKKSGLKLTRKSKKGYLRTLIEEVMDEMM